MRTASIAQSALMTALIAAPAAQAQLSVGAAAGLVTYSEGGVVLNGRAIEVDPAPFPKLKENQAIRSLDGRAEMLLNPCVALHLGEESKLRMMSDRLTDTRVELLAGSAVVRADRILKDTHITIWFGNAAVPLARVGIYRFDANPPRLRVFAGRAQLDWRDDSIPIESGHSADVESGSPVLGKFDPRVFDVLDRWSERRAVVLARESGETAREQRARQDDANAARENARLRGQTQGSRSIFFDPSSGMQRQPAGPQPLPMPAAGAPRMCGGPSSL